MKAIHCIFRMIIFTLAEEGKPSKLVPCPADADFATVMQKIKSKSASEAEFYHVTWQDSRVLFDEDVWDVSFFFKSVKDLYA